MYAAADGGADGNLAVRLPSSVPRSVGRGSIPLSKEGGGTEPTDIGGISLSSDGGGTDVVVSGGIALSKEGGGSLSMGSGGNVLSYTGGDALSKGGGGGGALSSLEGGGALLALGGGGGKLSLPCLTGNLHSTQWLYPAGVDALHVGHVSICVTAVEFPEQVSHRSSLGPMGTPHTAQMFAISLAINPIGGPPQ